MEWYKPYTLKQTNYFIFSNYKIIFEDTVIREWMGSWKLRDEMKDMVLLLNAAFNMGYSQHRAETQIYDNVRNNAKKISEK